MSNGSSDGDALVVAEIDREAGVFQRPGQIQRPQRHVQLALDLLAVAHEEHVQVDERDVGGHGCGLLWR